MTPTNFHTIEKASIGSRNRPGDTDLRSNSALGVRASIVWVLSEVRVKFTIARKQAGAPGFDVPCWTG